MRLIDADTLLIQIKYKPVPNIASETWNELYERVIEEIDNAPTVEQPSIAVIPPELIQDLAKTVVGVITDIDWKTAIEKYNERPHGKWIFEKANEEQTDGYICSVCKCSFHTKVPYFSEFNYCPNCGADMREDSDK